MPELENLPEGQTITPVEVLWGLKLLNQFLQLSDFQFPPTPNPFS